MNTFFNIHYEFDKQRVHTSIARQLEKLGSDYICVVDGVVLGTANRKSDYLRTVNGGMFSICDSSYVPLYIIGFTESVMSNIAEAKSLWTSFIAGSTG